MATDVPNKGKPHNGEMPSFDGLRLGVQRRLNRGEGEVLAVVTGMSLATLEWFAATGKIDRHDQILLEAMQ